MPLEFIGGDVLRVPFWDGLNKKTAGKHTIFPACQPIEHAVSIGWSIVLKQCVKLRCLCIRLCKRHARVNPVIRPNSEPNLKPR